MNLRRWLILCVVLLAGALTVWSAAAQEGPLPGSEPSAATERGESATPPANLAESEPNNNVDKADLLSPGNVIAGVIGGKGDQDYYRIDNTGATTAVLIDIDAEVLGSTLDAQICLYDNTLAEVACNDDADGRDSLLFASLSPDNAWPGAPYYVRVRDVDYPNEGDAAHFYNLALYRPLLISATTDGMVAGIPFERADILAHYDFADGTEKWLMFFDASDVGITGDVVGLATQYNFEDIALVLRTPQQLPINGVLQTVTPYDVLYFVAREGGRFGPKTEGQFYIGYAGDRFGLGGPGEKIDALALPFFVSTEGTATFASGETVRDEDISNLPYGFLSFDGSRVPGLGRLDVFAADEGGWPSPIAGHYLTILGSGRVGGQRVTQKDIFVVPWWTYQMGGIVWRGPDHGFKYDIDAFDMVD